MSRGTRVCLDDDHVTVAARSRDVEKIGARPEKVSGFERKKTAQFDGAASRMKVTVSTDHRLVVHREKERDDGMDLSVDRLLIKVVLALKAVRRDDDRLCLCCLVFLLCGHVLRLFVGLVGRAFGWNRL